MVAEKADRFEYAFAYWCDDGGFYPESTIPVN
jgi:hypothetical protein